MSEQNQQITDLMTAIGRLRDAFRLIDERQVVSQEERPYYLEALRSASDALADARYGHSQATTPPAISMADMHRATAAGYQEHVARGGD